MTIDNKLIKKLVKTFKYSYHYNDDLQAEPILRYRTMANLNGNTKL